MIISLFIKIEVELFSQALVLLVYLYANKADLALDTIVEAAVVKDQFHVLHELLNLLILMFLQLTPNSLKIHRVFHHLWIIRNVQTLNINWKGKNACFLIL